MNGFVGKCKKQHVKELSLGGEEWGHFCQCLTELEGAPGKQLHSLRRQECTVIIVIVAASSQQQAPLLKHLLRAGCGSHHSAPLSSLSPAALAGECCYDPYFQIRKLKQGKAR